MCWGINKGPPERSPLKIRLVVGMVCTDETQVFVTTGGAGFAIPARTKGRGMGDKPFIKFYPSDFLGGTSGLSPAERGVYITLLCVMYEADGPIERDDSRLSRRCGAPKAAFLRCLVSLIDEGKIIENNGMLFNSKAEKTLMDRTNRIQNGTHAARSRWYAQKQKKQQKQRPKDAAAMRRQCAGDAIPEPEPEYNGSSIEEPRRFSKSEGFEDFWKIWPSKKAKQNALKAWRKLTIEDKRAAFLAVRAGWFTRWQASSPDASPLHCSTFLNGRRWEDEISEEPMTRGQSQNGKRSVTERLASRYADMDFREGGNTPQPLLQTGDERRDRGSGDGGLDQDVIRLSERANQRGL